MTDVTIAASAGGLPAYVATPSGAGPFPGVVVVHDAFGLGNAAPDDLTAPHRWPGLTLPADRRPPPTPRPRSLRSS